MKHEPFSDEALAREMVLIRELGEQSDRGVAIVGLAWVEEALTDAVESFLEDDKVARQRLFRPSGPLATLSAKIDLIRLLGLASNVITADLHTMREIRNDFAHSVLAKDGSSLTFATPHISDKCYALKVVAHEEVDSPRHAFIRACAVLNSDFYLHKLVANRIESHGKVYAAIEEGRRSVRGAS